MRFKVILLSLLSFIFIGFQNINKNQITNNLSNLIDSSYINNDSLVYECLISVQKDDYNFKDTNLIKVVLNEKDALIGLKYSIESLNYKLIYNDYKYYILNKINKTYEIKNITLINYADILNHHNFLIVKRSNLFKSLYKKIIDDDNYSEVIEKDNIKIIFEINSEDYDLYDSYNLYISKNDYLLDSIIHFTRHGKKRKVTSYIYKKLKYNYITEDDFIMDKSIYYFND